MRVPWLFGGLLLASSVVAFGQEVVPDKPAPDFTMTGIDGKDVTLSQLTAEGKNVVLMFSRAHW